MLIGGEDGREQQDHQDGAGEEVLHVTAAAGGLALARRSCVGSRAPMNDPEQQRREPSDPITRLPLPQEADQLRGAPATGPAGNRPTRTAALGGGRPAWSKVAGSGETSVSSYRRRMISGRRGRRRFKNGERLARGCRAGVRGQGDRILTEPSPAAPPRVARRAVTTAPAGRIPRRSRWALSVDATVRSAVRVRGLSPGPAGRVASAQLGIVRIRPDRPGLAAGVRWTVEDHFTGSRSAQGAVDGHSGIPTHAPDAGAGRRTLS